MGSKRQTIHGIAGRSRVMDKMNPRLKRINEGQLRNWKRMLAG